MSDRREQLEKAGWRVGDAEDFLGMTKPERTAFGKLMCFLGLHSWVLTSSEVIFWAVGRYASTVDEFTCKYCHMKSIEHTDFFDYSTPEEVEHD